MWLGRGTRFPLTHGWRGGMLTRMGSALPACARSERPGGARDAVRVFARPPKILSRVCRDTFVDSDRRNPFRDEAVLPHSALARGPPLPC
jgi:hypothetical protein